MKNRLTYYLVFFPLILSAGRLAAQAGSCEKNMLFIPNSSSYAVIPAPKFSLPGAFTIEFWAQSMSFVPHSGLLEQTNRGDTGAFSIGFSGGSSLAVTLKLNDGIINITTDLIANVQRWYHYAITFTPNDSIRIFVDGILKTSVKTFATNLVASADSLLIARSELSGATFTGNIDELRIWSLARTPQAISTSMKTPLTGNEIGLAAYYSFDDDPGATIIHDFTGGKSDGNLVSSAALAASTSPVNGPPSAGYMLISQESFIKFPDLLCSTQSDATVHIINKGPEQVQIDPVTFLSGKVFSASIAGFPLDPGKTGFIHIQANPKAPDIYRDTLIITSTTVCGGNLRIPVEVRYDNISIAFEDSVFNLHDNLLPCDLPIHSQTFLQNTGSKAATIVLLQFSPQAGINIDSPATPFILEKGQTVPIKFTVNPGSSGIINTTLTALTAECSRTANILFLGKRIAPGFSIIPRVDFPAVHLPPASLAIDTIIFLKNTGTATLTMNPPLLVQGNPGFQLLSPKFGLAIIPPDSSLAIKIRFTSSGTECGIFESSLHIQDAATCSIDTSIPLSINVLGPDVSPQNVIYNFGASCSAHDSLIMFVNKSGRTVTLGNPEFSADNIFSLGDASLPKTLLAGDSIELKFHFAPVSPGKYIINVHFPLSPCGETDVQFEGLLGIGDIALSDSVLDFGNGCDLTAATKKITITNKTGKQIAVSDTLFTGSHRFSLINPPLPFQMGIGESKDILVEFNPAQLGTSEESQISLFDSGCFVTAFEVRGVREHANKSWTNPEFGTVCPGNTETINIAIENNGYGDFIILRDSFVTLGSLFRIDNMAGTTIGHGATKTFSASFSPTDTGEFRGILQVLIGPCGDTAEIVLHGIGGPRAQLLSSDSVLDFGTIRFGSTDSLCIVLQNPSCIPLRISADSVHSVNANFSLIPTSLHKLPDSVTIGNPLTLCFLFAPKKIGTFEAQDTIKIGSEKIILTLRGKAGIDSLIFSPRRLDFGDVLKDSTKPLRFTIRNSGLYPASITVTQLPAKDFDFHDSIQKTIGGFSFLTDSVFFAPKHFGLQTSFIVLQWDNHFDTIQLIGRGIEPGLEFPLSTLDFSQVRVGHDSSITISDSNTLDFSVDITNTIMNGSVFTTSRSGSANIDPHGTISYSITYRPVTEGTDSGSFLLVTKDNGTDTLLLRGIGVDAHLKVDTTNINFGYVGIGQKNFRNLRISNTGAYPLAITNISKALPQFGTAVIPSVISPDSSILLPISFAPTRAVNYLDTLRIDADAPEKNALVSLAGRGVFSPLGIPEVSYHIPDVQAKVGDILEIPITIEGKDLALFDLDSFDITLSFDPTVVYFHDTVITDGTESSGFSTLFKRLTDSTINISGSGNSIIATPNRPLFILKAEALLGPRDSTRIVIVESEPKNTGDLLSSSGAFVVSDCGNYRSGIIFKGSYSVSDIKPNPISTSAHIDYELGLNGNVSIDLFDALGRHVKTITSENETAGKHSAQFSVEDIPSGEYIFVLKSLEYEYRGSMIIAK